MKTEGITENGNQKSVSRNAAIDCMKYISAFLVVAIHISPLQSIHGMSDFILTRIVARIAVPFFFMVSGYFVLSGSKRHNEKVLRFLKKTCLLYLAAMVLYLPVNYYTGYFHELKAGTVLRDIFFDGTFYHLWYLPAVILGVVICLFLIRAFGEKAAFVITIILYLAGLPGDSYHGLTRLVPFLGEVYGDNGIFRIFSYTRNGIFFAPVFLMAGCIIRRSGEKEENEENEDKNTRPLAFGIGALLCFAAMLAEGLLLHKYEWQRHDSMYLFLLPLMCFFFLWLLEMGKNKEEDSRNAGISQSLGSMAMVIYIIHPLVLILLRGVSKPLGLYEICVENTLICYLLVSLASAVGAWILVLLYRIVTGRVSGKRGQKEKSGKKNGKNLPDLETDRAWVEIDLGHLKWNVEEIRRILPKGCRFMAIVKDNAYGHGDVVVSKCLYDMGIKNFAVATLEEGIHLRQNGVKGKILILGYTCPENAPYLSRYHLIQTVVDENYARELNEQGISLKVHIKVDTGMHRLGEDYRNADKIAGIFDYPNLEVVGIYSHLCISDGRDEKAVSYTEHQIENFESVLEAIREEGHKGVKTHLQSSYGTVNYPELQCSYVRMGIMMYGCLSSLGDEIESEVELKGVLSLKARVALVRKLKAGECIGYGCTFKAPRNMLVAAVTIGYGDGYPRNISGQKADVLVKGRRAEIIGRICMDQLTIDVTDIEGVKPGDVVTLIGRDGKESITAEEVADIGGTITNELLCRMGSRLGYVITENGVSNH